MSFYSTPGGQKGKLSFHPPRTPPTIISMTVADIQRHSPLAFQTAEWQSRERGRMARVSCLCPAKGKHRTGPGEQQWPRAHTGWQMLRGAVRDPPCSPGRASTGPSTRNSGDFCKVPWCNQEPLGLQSVKAEPWISLVFLFCYKGMQSFSLGTIYISD